MIDISPVLYRYRSRHRHHYHHKTAAGNALFWIGGLVFLIFINLYKYGGERCKKNKVVSIMSVLGIVLLLASYPIDMIFA